MAANGHKAPRRLRLILEDDRSHDQIWTWRTSGLRIAGAAAAAVIALSAFYYSLIALTPIRTTIPGYPDAAFNRAVVSNAIKVDSLESVIALWELYSENLRHIAEGSAPIPVDSIVKVRAYASQASAEKAAADSILRAQVIEEERFSITGKKNIGIPIEGIHFFTPLKGMISVPFDRISHPCLDITAPGGSSVNAVLDGTVVFAGWTEDDGYVLHIQHQGDMISVYRGCNKIMARSGDKVRAGQVIGLDGGDSEREVSHLHFELWYRGEPVNAAEYISF